MFHAEPINPKRVPADKEGKTLGSSLTPGLSVCLEGGETMHEDDVDVTPVKVGDHVIIVNETYEEHDALVTAVHGNNWEMYTPSINVVYISSDPSKHDPYGQQLERLSSLGHYNVTHGMPKRGRYWRNV